MEVQRAMVPATPAQAFPRSAAELRILTALQHASPRALTAQGIARQIDMAVAEVARLLYALALTHAINHNEKGFYWYQPRHEERM
jgi:DNA-binding IclR family transcriptional regulator